MKALITGVSSGIGHSLALELSRLGYDIIGVSRNEEKMLKIKGEISTQFIPICLDISSDKGVQLLYEKVKDENIDILINNAGVGIYGDFKDITIEEDMKLINLNVIALHKITKLFIKKMESQEKGYILNVASLASFMPGPLMATYYASKAYVLSLSEAIAKELEIADSPVRVAVLCPGPVDTDFNKKMGIKFSKKPLSPEYVARYAIKQLLLDKEVIIPGFKNKLVYFASRIFSRKMIINANYRVQKGKSIDDK